MALHRGERLKLNSIPNDLFQKTKEYLHPGDEINRIVIEDIQDDGNILLEFWCLKAKEKRSPNAWNYNVFHIKALKSHDWVIEGRGFKEN